MPACGGIITAKLRGIKDILCYRFGYCNKLVIETTAEAVNSVGSACYDKQQ